MKKFKPFYFDGNLYFGDIETPEDIKPLLSAYDYFTIRRAREYHGEYDKSKRSFGFYHEYSGDLTLGDWIDANNLGIFFDIKKERQEKLKKLSNK